MIFLSTDESYQKDSTYRKKILDAPFEMSNNDPTETNQRKQASNAARHQGREIQHTGLASAVGVANQIN